MMNFAYGNKNKDSNDKKAIDHNIKEEKSFANLEQINLNNIC